MKITGELLKNERINKNLTIQDVAVSLKLSAKIVAAIEAGNLDALPAKTFVRGFVKSYAQFLKLDPDVVLRQFQEEMGTTSPLPKVPPPKPTDVKPIKPSSRTSLQSSDAKNYLASDTIAPEGSKNIIWMLGIAFALVIVLVVSNKIIESVKENPIAVETDKTNGSTVTNVEMAVAESSTDNETPPATDGAADAAAKSTTSEAVSLDKTKVVTAEEVFPPSPGGPVEVMLEAKKDIEVFYAKGNTREFFPLKLSANQIQVLRSKVGLHIKTSDGGALKLSVNGLEKGSAGPNNTAVKLSF